MYRPASGRTQRHRLPNISSTRTTTWAAIGVPARKALANAATSNGFGTVDGSGVLQPVLQCVSLSAWSRSGAHAAKSQFPLFPGVTPERPNRTEGRSTSSLEHPAVGRRIPASLLIWNETLHESPIFGILIRVSQPPV